MRADTDDESSDARISERFSSDLQARCESANLILQQMTLGDEPVFVVDLKKGRDVRRLYLDSDDAIARLLSIPFEKYVFLADYEAICSYTDGYVEAAVQMIGTAFLMRSFLQKRLFSGVEPDIDGVSPRLTLHSPREGLPNMEIGPPSKAFKALAQSPTRARITFKLSGCSIKTHDEAIALLKRTSDSLFFQIDLLADIAMSLERERTRRRSSRRLRTQVNLATTLQYPRTEFDDAPISLYWYARSAAGMPLLQFLAFYQVIEFYFPTYSQIEAHRRLKSILKDPTFRGDRDADIGKLLSAIHVNRGGAFGDERSQLRATIAECVDQIALREFFESEADRKAFYLAKSPSYRKVPLSNPTADLRADVADRIYDIRCKIVHTKTDSRDGDIELLLPFSREAEQLFYDIDLVRFLAQSILIAGSTSFDRGA